MWMVETAEYLDFRMQVCFEFVVEFVQLDGLDSDERPFFLFF